MIVVKAMEVFARKGFEGATSRDLAAAAGVSEGLIYKYFPTKEALYQELASLLRADSERFSGLFAGTTPDGAAFVEAFYTLARLILFGPPGRAKDTSVDRLIGQSLLGDGTFAAAFLENLFHPIVPFLVECLAVAYADGDIDGRHVPGEFQCVLFHHLIGTIALFRLPELPMLPAMEPEALLRDLLLFAYRGIGFTEAALGRYVDFERLDRHFLATLTKRTNPS
ncbi:MAG TPA: helix-turn-helix domain-containing protein [Fimbriimonadaceae bacterium]|nr:helix-turn-helix domain-containing protein [Fimbriimonadaceae bacterium]